MFTAFLRYFDTLGEPVGFLWLLQVLAAGFLLWRRRWLGAFILLGLASLGTFMGATGIPKLAIASLERPYVRTTLADLTVCDAIVCLGGGHTYSPHDPFGLELRDAGDRIITALELARQHKANALVLSGGTMTVNGKDRELSLLLKNWVTAWGITSVPVYYLEQIKTTWDEARQVQALAKDKGWKQIMLVTSAYHMRRAEAVFKATGLKVVPVACDFKGLDKPERDHVWKPWPELWRYELWGYYVHEELGWLLYRLKGYASPQTEAEPPPAQTQTTRPQTAVR